MKLVQLVSHDGKLFGLTEDGSVYERTFENVPIAGTCSTFKRYLWQKVPAPPLGDGERA